VTHLAVLHGLRADSRSTNVQNVVSFSTNLGCRQVTNINAFGLIPKVLRPDVIVLTYDFLALRTWPIWKILIKRVRALIEAAPIRIAFPQDDYTNCESLDQLFCDFGITHVYSPITVDLELLYPRAIRRSIRFSEALTGYVDDWLMHEKKHLMRPFALRAVDLGQRVRMLGPHLGSAASVKAEVAIRFAAKAKSLGFGCDVSTNPSDVLLGDDWYRFLGNCRFSVGAKGGASIADPRGKLADRVRRLKLRYPQMSNSEIGDRMNSSGAIHGNFGAVSPRMFECAAMGACQILKRDDYFDGFEPWKHYVPIDSVATVDPKVWTIMRDFDQAEVIVRESQKFLLESGKYTYKHFLSRLAKDVGIEQTNIATIVTDSSIQLDAAIGHHGSALEWLQSYISRAVARGDLDKVERGLESGQLFPLNKNDLAYRAHAEENWDSALSWIRHFRAGDLMVESIAIPWRTASSFLAM